MKRVTFGICLLLTGGVAVFATCGSAGIQQRGCVRRSVKKAAYVAANEAIFKTVPVPPRARRINAYSIGIPSPDSCIPKENGPPYSAYATWHVYRTPRHMNKSEVIAFYRRALPDTWSLRVYGQAEATFRRGQAYLYVTATRGDAYRPAAFLLSVDHAGYAGRGH